MGGVLVDGEAFQRAQLLAALKIVLLDVPGVPGARLVLRVDPELIAAPRERFAPRRLMDEAGDRSVLSDLDA